MGARPSLAPGDAAFTVTDDLRVRSKPWVGDDSIKYEPLLERNTGLSVIEGPIAGSGLWWYRVKLMGDLQLRDGITEGWVAAADKNGVPWLERFWDTTGSVFQADGWPSVTLDGVRLIGDLDDGTDTPDWGIKVTVVGASPGTVEALELGGDYRIDWVCFAPDPDPSSGGLDPGRLLDATELSGTATDEIRLTVRPDGTATGVLVLRAPRPARPCATPGAWYAESGSWGGTVIDIARSMALSPPPEEWETVY